MDVSEIKENDWLVASADTNCFARDVYYRVRRHERGHLFVVCSHGNENAVNNEFLKDFQGKTTLEDHYKQLLDLMVFSDSAPKRLVGRMLASGVGECLSRWMNEDCDATEGPEFSYALVNLLAPLIHFWLSSHYLPEDRRAVALAVVDTMAEGLGALFE